MLILDECDEIDFLVGLNYGSQFLIHQYKDLIIHETGRLLVKGVNLETHSVCVKHLHPSFKKWNNKVVQLHGVFYLFKALDSFTFVGTQTGRVSTLSMVFLEPI